MKLLSEVFEDVKYLVEDKENGAKSYFIEGVFMQGNLKNRNGRVYRVETLEREVDRYIREHVQKNRAYGELGHPSGPTINLERVSHMIKDLRREGNNFVGRAKVMDTPYGNIVKNLMSEGACLGVSSRGLGSVKANKEGVMEVQDDFFLATAGDIVSDPSAPDAFVQNVMEGAEWLYIDGRGWVMEQAQRQIEQIVQEVQFDKKAREQRFAQVFEQFMKTV